MDIATAALRSGGTSTSVMVTDSGDGAAVAQRSFGRETWTWTWYETPYVEDGYRHWAVPVRYRDGGFQGLATSLATLDSLNALFSGRSAEI